MTIGKRGALRTTLFLAAGSFIFAHLCFLLLPSVFEAWNAQTMDRLSALRAGSARFRTHYDDTVVHVDLDNTTIRMLGKHYLNRTQHARVIRNLAEMGASVQVYDFIFAAPSNPEEDRALIEAATDAGSVHMGLAFRFEDGRTPVLDDNGDPATREYLQGTTWHPAIEGDAGSPSAGQAPLITFPDLALACRGLGHMNVRSDGDGVFRRLPLLVRYGDGIYPSLALRAVCAYLGVPPDKIIVRPGRSVTLQDAGRPGTGERRDIRIPVDRQGNMRIDFIGPWERMKHYHFADVLRASEDRYEMARWRQELAEKIVVISEVSTGSTDVGPVPTDVNFPLSGIHAGAIHTILTESFVREIGGPAMTLIELLLLAAVVSLSLRCSAIPFAIGALFLSALYAAGEAAAFLAGNFALHVTRPLLMVAVALTTLMVYRYFNEERAKLEGLRQRDFIRGTFGRYLSNEVVEELLDTPEGLQMSGEIRTVTFLVSDLRGFTPLSERLSPREVIDILNRYLERMVGIIGRYRGTVDEFQGDGILVFFGAPLSAEDDPERAVACAVEMQNAMPEINSEQRRLGLPDLAMGIGIHTGDVVVGNIGSEKRAKYGAVGSPINLAYRIQAQTAGGQVLISADTHEHVRSIAAVRGTMAAQLKGIDRPVTMYDIAGLAGRYGVSLRDGR